MADGDQSDRDKNFSSPQRRPHYQNRGAASSYRGRGRGNNPSVSKALYLFGVRDLREILDKKHEEQGQIRSGPPPDPSYNYLKDPARECTSERQTHRYHKDHQESRGHFPRGSRGYRRGGPPRDPRHSEPGSWKKPETTYIQNPVNIKVEVASSGERSCKIDEETKLADIKHVPNSNFKDLRPPRKETNRGRGERFPRNEPDRGRGEDIVGERFNRGRGRGQRGGRRGRGGRGDRGGGRGRYFTPRNTQQNQTEHLPAAPEVASEENWDTEEHAVGTEEEKHSEELHEAEEYAQGEDHEEYEEEYLEANEPGLEEAPNDSGINLDENLIITSSNAHETGKRSVKFEISEDPQEVASTSNKEHENKDETETPKNESNKTTNDD